ncbi:DUF5753 domain-containing protein [Streptomyces sp. NPDC051130]|uniref:DUF5753 domain-containing protein n=1 Tax=Streptomyces sp. NPDC051130 TaxID=3157223 RepID=UPI00343D8D5E
MRLLSALDLTVATALPGELVTAAYLSAVRRSVGVRRRRAAGAAGLPTHELRRLERGGPGLDLHTAACLMRTYGITAGQDIEAVAVLLGSSDVALWDSGPGSRDRLTACERASPTIRMWAAHWIPDLLQTAEYAKVAAQRVLIDNEPGPVQLGLRCLSRRNSTVTVLLDEFVLRRPIGGASVMAGQLAHLKHLVRCRAATIRIVPVDCGIPPLGSQVAELHLPRGRLYVDESIGIHYSTDPMQRLQYRAHLDALEAAAISANQSYHWLGRARTAFDVQV